MFIDVDLLPAWLVVASAALMLLGCLAAALLAPWKAIRAVPARLHLVLGGSLFCLLLWLLSVHMVEQLWLHFLGVTCLVMLLGLRLALLAGALAMGLLGLAGWFLADRLGGIVFFTPAQIVGFVVFCVGLGLVGSWSAMRKYLTMESEI